MEETTEVGFLPSNRQILPEISGINSCIEMDITGQAASSTIGARVSVNCMGDHGSI